MLGRVTVSVLLALWLGCGCGASAGGGSPRPAGAPSAAVSPAATGASPGTGTPAPSASATAEAAVDLATLDAAIRAADPQNLVTPVLACINVQLTLNASIMRREQAMTGFGFYAAVAGFAKSCGVAVNVNVSGAGDQVTYRFVKPV